MTETEADTLIAVLEEAIDSALPELTQSGWTFVGITRRFLMQTNLPVVSFKRDAHSLSFIVAPTDPHARAFKRTKRFDVSYFSEDVGDNEQAQIYRRDRSQIEAVAAWLRRWDG